MHLFGRFVNRPYNFVHCRTFFVGDAGPYCILLPPQAVPLPPEGRLRDVEGANPYQPSPSPLVPPLPQ